MFYIVLSNPALAFLPVTPCSLGSLLCGHNDLLLISKNCQALSSFCASEFALLYLRCPSPGYCSFFRYLLTCLCFRARSSTTLSRQATYLHTWLSFIIVPVTSLTPHRISSNSWLMNVLVSLFNVCLSSTRLWVPGGKQHLFLFNAYS